MHLHFEEVFRDAYVIYLDNERVGFLSMKTDNVIQSLDIETAYVDKLKECLVDRILFELGKDELIVVCSPECCDYYYQFGFKNVGKKRLRYSG